MMKSGFETMKATDTMTTMSRYIWVAPDRWEPLDQVAADPRRRAEALAAAQKRRARRKYLALVNHFAPPPVVISSERRNLLAGSGRLWLVWRERDFSQGSK